MPLYLYAIINLDNSDGETFEVLQGLNDAALTHHPESGKPVRRLLSAPNVARKSTMNPGQSDLSDRNLERLGFTKYQKSSSGYEKTAGSGPDQITQ